jgi:hypothetical protein
LHCEPDGADGIAGLCYSWFVIDIVGAILGAFGVFFRSRLDSSLEVLALRQQVAVLKRKRRRPVLSRLDRLFWIMLRSVWPRWSDVLAIVKPATVIRWHRKGFRYIGAGDPGGGVVDLGSTKRSAISSAK